eukprot:NODE_95_length_21460_cov_0.300220.p2 type:complete len:509 gc:universal NODE_95_length_21460_cov_0.300220:12674-14200(+)
MKRLTQSCFDRCLPTALVTQDLHHVEKIEVNLPISTIHLQNLFYCKQYHAIANYSPTSDVEAYIVAYCKYKINNPLKHVLNFIKEQMITRDCDFLRMLYAQIASDLPILIDLQSSEVSYTWHYWYILSLLVNKITDLDRLKNHPWYPIGLAYTTITRNIKVNEFEIFNSLLKSDFTDILFYILQLIYNMPNTPRLVETTSLSNSPYLPDFAHIISNELSKLDDLESTHSLAMQLSLEDPLNPNTKVAQAVYYSLKNMNLKSVELLTTAIEIDPSPLAFLLLGHEYFQFGNYKKAVNCYLNVIKLNKIDVRGWAAVGDVYFSMGLFEQAIRYYSESAQITQKDGYIYMQLGNCFEKLENPQMWYNSVLRAWELQSSSTTTLALYKSAKAYGLDPVKVFQILKNAFNQDSTSLDFSLLEELIEYCIYYKELEFGTVVYKVAKQQAGWINQSKLNEIQSKLESKPVTRSFDNSSIRNAVPSAYSDNNHSSACDETPTRNNRQEFGYYELGR